MSKAIINDLPTEIIIAILRKVDQESLKNAILTCKLWKELIENSCKWSISLDHHSTMDTDEHWIDYLLRTNRKFHKIRLDSVAELSENKIVDIFQRHGSHISKFFVFQKCLDRFELFVEMLKRMPNLEHLILFQIRTPSTVADILTEDKLPELIKLKTLELVHSDDSIMKCFKRSKLTKLKILANEDQSMAQESVLELLRTQPQIKTLALRNIDYDTSTLFQTDLMDGSVKFQLSQLSLLDMKLRESPNDYNNLLKFLKPQAKTVKFLELGKPFPDLVYEFIFAKFKHLKTLRLMINELPKDMEFYERLEENQNITKLILTDSPPPNHLNNGCPPSLKEFILHVPNVTDLTLLEDCDRGTLQFIASNLKNLKRLAVTYFSESIFAGLQFPNLTRLHIQKIEDDFDWDNFTKMNPGITELQIDSGTFPSFSDWSEKSYSDFVEKVTKNLRLQTLKIGSRFRTNEHFYEIIRGSGTELKTIDLHKACALDSHIMEGIPGLRFHEDDPSVCFLDSEMWNNEDYDGLLPEIDRGGNWGDDEEFLDPFDMHLMDIDDLNEYDNQEYDFYDGFDDEDDLHADSDFEY